MVRSQVRLMLLMLATTATTAAFGLAPLSGSEMQGLRGRDIVYDNQLVLGKECHFGGSMACADDSCAQYQLHMDTCTMDVWVEAGDGCMHVEGEGCEEWILGTVYVRGWAPEQKWGACDQDAETNCTQTSIVCAEAYAFGSAQDCQNFSGPASVAVHKCGCDLGPWEEEGPEGTDT